MFGRSNSQETVVDGTEMTTTTEKLPRKPIYLDTRTLTSHIFFGPYVWLPIIATLVWLANLLTLMALWARAGKPQYKPDEGSKIVYISDVAAVHKTFFIVMNAILAFFYISTMFAERWLRGVDRIPGDLRKREEFFDGTAILFSVVAMAGLLLLSVEDAFNHSTHHYIGVGIFVVGTAVSAAFQSGEVWSLRHGHPDRAHLLRNSVFKLVVVFVAIVLAIAFIVTLWLSNSSKHGCNVDPLNSYCDYYSNVSGALEWAVAFVLVFYYFSLIMDLWPAGKSSPRYMRRLARWQENHAPHSEHDFIGRRAFNFDGSEEIWRGQDGHALPPDAPVVNGGVVYENSEAGRQSTTQNSEAGLMRQV